MSVATLVVAPSWIGDAVLTHPLLGRLKARDPGCAIDVLAPAWASAVFGRMPEVRSTIAFPFGHGELEFGGRRRFAKTLPRYDRAIVLPNSLKSALVPWFAGIPVRTGWRGEMRYGLLNDLRSLDESALPLIVERYAALAQSPGEALERPLPAPRLTVDLARRDETLAKFGLDARAPVLALAPGAEFGPAKRWPARHFATLARSQAALGFRIWLFGSGQDATVTAEIATLAGVPVTDLAGKTGLDEAIDLLSLAARVVTNDSGLMHVAAALDRPLAAVFGSSSPAYTPPLSTKARVVSLKLECSPCFKRECPLGHTNCLETLDPAQVLSAFE
ncbi:MAG: lipopolysaccharide heptosyltransferase II [Betaproteobacteria bacterium]|nr:lipopolysaccharide heptosyltransferase II [Betaproteobacteria bacterium]